MRTVRRHKIRFRVPVPGGNDTVDESTYNAGTIESRAPPPASRGRAASPLALSGTGAAPSPVIYDYVDKRDAAAVPTSGPCCATLSDIATCSFSICIYYLVSTYVLTPMTIPCDIPNQIGAVAAISDFCDNRCYGDPRSWLGAGRENTVNRQPPVPTTEYRRAVHNAGRGIEHPVRSGPRLLRGARESSPPVVLGVVLVGAAACWWRAGAAGRGGKNNGNCAPIIVFVTAVGIPA